MLEVRGLKKHFDDADVLRGISLRISAGEFVTLLGPSGCGKTTTLRIVAGLTEPDEGSVLLDGKDITNLPPEKRDVNTVFQSYALFPHMNVGKNIAYGLRVRGVKKDERARRVEEMLRLVALEGFEKRMPSQLSGGQRQRIAIARALVLGPKLLLLDEPLGALDLKLRQQMQRELKDIQKRLGIAFLYVTHDQEEALNLSDRIAIMRDGLIEQVGAPEEIYHEPNNVFTAQFIGTPPMNIMEMSGGSRVGFRPEKVVLGDRPDVQMPIRMRGTIATREMLGAETQYKVVLKSGATIMVKSPDEGFREGAAVCAMVPAPDVHFFDAKGQHIGHGGPADLLKAAGGMNDA